MHWVEEAFRWVLQTSWQAAVLVGLILLAQRLLRRRLAPAWRYGLWLLLVARLLMPVVPPSGFSIFNLVRTDGPHSRVDAWQPSRRVGANPHPPINNFDATPSTDFASANESRRDPFNPSIAPSGVVISPNPMSPVDWLKVLCCGWLAGVLFFASRLVWANVRFRSRIERHRPVANENVTQLFDECRKEFKIIRPVRIIESPEVESPGVYGIWRKWLLLPEGVFERFSREELRHTFLHELAHLKRRDLEVNWLTACLQILHWFNPVIWLAFARMRADRELATDALVLAHAKGTDNVAYGETIIKVAANLAQRGMQPGLVGIAESKAGLQERLRAIAGAGVTRYWTWAAAGIVAILGGAGLTGAQGTDQPEAAATSKNSTSGLNHTAGIFGRVVDVRGRPVNNAQVAIYRLEPRTWFDGSPLPASSGLDLTCAPTPRIFNPDFGHPMAELSLPREQWSFCTTDVRGDFYLDDLAGALSLLAVSESGFGWTATNAFSSNMTVKLQRWGRIEGTLWHYNEVVTNEPVRVFFAYQDGVPSWGPECGFNTKTDGYGHFSFDFVPPGHFGVNGAGMGERVTVKSGQTSVVKLGGSGVPVVGKLKIHNPDGEIEPADEFHYIFLTSRPDLEAKTKEELSALRKQPGWEKTFTNFHIRPVQCGKDGSFRIDQVQPGKYVLLAETSAVATKHRLWLAGTRDVEIPASDPKVREPLDLGLIEVMVKSPARSNE
jgi:beta-lactamase regulating signal transducer with metallopeptidase domain